MEAHIRVRGRTLSLEIVEIHRDWKVRLTGQEKGGMCSTLVGLHAGSLEKAKELADRLAANEHTCDGRCREWERLCKKPGSPRGQ
jgi:hypothetical protein